VMHEPEKSDSVVVAGKPTNKAEQSAAEPVEPRTETKGNAGQQSTHRAQDRASVSQAPGTRTASRKAKEEGEVHLAPAPYRPRHAENGVLRDEA
jgi:RNA-directed DNA polymerase